MTRNTARTLKALDPHLLRAALTLANLVEMRADLDQPSTEELVREIIKSLLQAACKKEEHAL